MKIAVVGTGYVGLSNAVLLSQKYEVIALDIDEHKIAKINNKQAPIEDEQISSFLQGKELNLTATLDKELAYENADYIVIATPTNYNTVTKFFDTSSVEKVIADAMQYNPQATIVIKSTIPVGFTDTLKERLQIANIFFSPEFLREGKALYDNLYPSRIVIGSKTPQAKSFADIMIECASKENIETLFTDNTVAEAIKLFSNTYLALRVAYFNELDTYASVHDLNTQELIKGVGLDPRIGDFYNNPSFGYGGYCLPKDTQQLLANYQDIPQNLIEAVVISNKTRKKFIAKDILDRNPKKVGIYRLVMKAGSDNFRDSAIIDVIKQLKSEGTEVVVYEPMYREQQFLGSSVVNDLDEFKRQVDLIVANRITNDIQDVVNKVYTRDLSGSDL